MFYQYEIHSQGNEDILYLYLSIKYEFAEELTSKNQESLTQKAKNFIISNKIPFHGHKVYLIIDGIVVKTLDISNINETIIDIDYSQKNFPISIKLNDKTFIEITLYDYILSILLSKYEEDMPDEVYKAIAILYTTYAYKEMKENKYLSNNQTFSIYKPLSYYEDILSNFKLIIQKLNTILKEIDGLFLTYQGELILPFIHYSNEGKTLTNPKYPYLSSVKSLWDLTSPYYIKILDMTYETIQKKYGITLTKNSKILVQKENIQLDDKVYTKEELKNIFQLKSSSIYFIMHKDYLRIITKGYGNFYGISIYGAKEIAKDNGKYYDILKYYFPKVKLCKYIKELS